MNINEQIKYWIDSSDDDFQAMIHLFEKGNLILDDNQKDILDTISAFNIRGRYDDYKREFHKKCSNSFTKEWVDNIKEFREWIKKQLRK